MKRLGPLYIGALVLLSFLGLAIWQSAHSRPVPELAPLPLMVPAATGEIREPIQPIPLRIPLDARKVALGRRLFHDPILSRDNTVSCASCHDLAAGGDDGRAVAVGVGGARGTFNSPTVLNTGFSFRQFWDGRQATLEGQVAEPLLAPHEMGNTWEQILRRLPESEDYRAAFASLYPDGVRRENVQDAIATFERSLFTPNARFDQYLRSLAGDPDGRADAITPAEKKGYALFKSYGCASCHQGVNAGGNMFQKLGVVRPYFQPGRTRDADLGRYRQTRDEHDRHVFKVPGLRNVALTAPYFHDGSVASLDGAVALMGFHQLGRMIAHDDGRRIVEFLRTLNGQVGARP